MSIRSYQRAQPSVKRVVALSMALALALLLLPSGVFAASAVVVGPGPVDVYATAHTGSPVITQLAVGAQVQLGTVDTSWAQVMLGGGTSGYVPIGYLSLLPDPAPTPIMGLSILGWATVTASSLNVHEAPSQDAAVYTQLAQGTHVEVVSNNGAWSGILLDGGSIIGYVASSYLSYGASATAGPTSAPHVKADTANANATVDTANGGPLHLRNHPSKEASILDSYANGSRIRVLSQSGGWYYVRVNSRTGYMDVDFITLDDGVQMTGETGYDAVVANPKENETLHLREKPSIDSTILGDYGNGTYVQVLDVGTEWDHVMVDGQEGYMMAPFVEITSPEATPNRIVKSEAQAYAELYAMPSTDKDSIAEVANGQMVTVLVPDAEWSAVTFSINGQIESGYMKNSDLQPVELPSTEFNF